MSTVAFEPTYAIDRLRGGVVGVRVVRRGGSGSGALIGRCFTTAVLEVETTQGRGVRAVGVSVGGVVVCHGNQDIAAAQSGTWQVRYPSTPVETPAPSQEPWMSRFASLHHIRFARISLAGWAGRFMKLDPGSREALRAAP